MPPFNTLAMPARGGGGGRERCRIVAARRWLPLPPPREADPGRGSEADGAPWSAREPEPAGMVIDSDGERATDFDFELSGVRVGAWSDNGRERARADLGESSSGPALMRESSSPVRVSAVMLELRAGDFLPES